MPRDTSVRSSEDRIDTSLILWAIEFLVAGATVIVHLCDLQLGISASALMACAYLLDLLRQWIEKHPRKHTITPQRVKLQDLSEGVNMSRTVSFRASEKLDEFLEQEAERRLVTKSTVAQMLVAERYRQLQGERESGSETPEVDETGAEVDEIEAEANDLSGGDSKGELPELERHPDKWYVPDSDKGYEYAVRMAAGGRVKYYKTAKGAANRLQKEYE